MHLYKCWNENMIQYTHRTMIYGGNCKNSQNTTTRNIAVIGYGLIVYDYGITLCDCPDNGPRLLPVAVCRRHSSCDLPGEETAWRVTAALCARLCIRRANIRYQTCMGSKRRLEESTHAEALAEERRESPNWDGKRTRHIDTSSIIRCHGRCAVLRVMRSNLTI